MESVSPTGCESGAACNVAMSASSFLDQGKDFAMRTSAYHGGKRTRKNSRKNARKNMRKMRGGAVELAAFPFVGEALEGQARMDAGIGALDKAIADLPQFKQTGGKRKSRKSQRKSRKHRKTMKGGVLGYADIDAPSMILSPAEQRLAFLSSGWETENLVNPNFRGTMIPLENTVNRTTGGGKKSRKSRKSRKGSKKSHKSRKAMKGGKKSRKGSKKDRKTGRK